MSKIPFENHTITVNSELYGRDGLLKKLIFAVKDRHENINVVGCRRFGKTCVLRVLTNLIKQDQESNCYPIYIDPKNWNLTYNENGKIGTPNVYRFLLAILLETLYKDGLSCEEVVIRGIRTDGVADRHSFFNLIGKESDSSIADTFADVVIEYSQKIKKTIAFIFDEYEFLMTKAFSESTGFQTLRKLSAEDINGFRPFSFVVAGAVTWEHLCSTIGSKELNTIGSHIYYVKPLKCEDFFRYWEDECEKIEDIDMRQLMSGKKEMVYKQSGGVIFHANDIASAMLVNDGALPEDYRPSISEVFDSLNFSEKETLKLCASTSKEVLQKTSLHKLRSLGLVTPETVKIPIGILNDWILEECKSDSYGTDSYIDKKVDTINDLIECINNTSYNKRKKFIFMPQNQDNTLTAKMKSICIDKFTFSYFVDAVWKTHFERTKNPKIGKNKYYLPYNYRVTKFTNIVATLRHVYSGHIYGPSFIPNEGDLSKEDALYALVGSKNEPYTKEEFLQLQKAILDMYLTELKGILIEERGMQ